MCIKYKVISIIAIISVIMQMTGCTSSQIAHNLDSNETSLHCAASDAEYTIFLIKEVSALSNILFTRIAAAETISNSGGASQAEIDLAEQSLSKIQDIQNEISSIMPAQKYTTEYENMVSLSQSAYNVISSYIETLKAGGDVKNSIEQMRMLYTELAGEANIAY